MERAGIILDFEQESENFEDPDLDQDEKEETPITSGSGNLSKMNVDELHRITSYNVCYTKLLRFNAILTSKLGMKHPFFQFSNSNLHYLNVEDLGKAEK